MALEVHRAIPPILTSPSTGPYWVGGDPAPAPATATTPKKLPERITTPVAIPPLRSESKPDWVVPSIPVPSR